MQHPPLKILYIAGFGRSGSTILGNILNEIDGFFHVGELCYLAQKSLIHNTMCGCGVAFQECTTWNYILDKAFGGFDQINSQQLLNFYEKAPKNKEIILKLLVHQKISLDNHTENYLIFLRKLYLAIHSITESNVIVDSSKLAWYGYLLGKMPNIQLYILHLIRDSRSTGYSWRRKKLRTDTKENKNELMERTEIITSSCQWNSANLAIKLIAKSFKKPYLQIKYEDFIQSPQETTETVLSFIKEKNNYNSLTFDNAQVNLGLNHTIWGNPNRIETGPIKLSLDNEWQTNMKLSDKMISTILTLPWLIKYGYVI
jgi:hypothetical protein